MLFLIAVLYCMMNLFAKKNWAASKFAKKMLHARYRRYPSLDSLIIFSDILVIPAPALLYCGYCMLGMCSRSHLVELFHC